MSYMTTIATVALCVALGGCTGSLSTYYSSTYWPGEVYAVPVIVRGDPFGPSKVPLQDSVVEAMRGNTAFPTSFSVLPEGQIARAYRTVIMFEPPVWASGWVLCTEDPARLPPAGDTPATRFPVTAALCRGDRPMSSAFGTIEGSGPDDPRFRQSIASLTTALFPAQNPDAQLFGGASQMR
jgi:hypothetical protein